MLNYDGLLFEKYSVDGVDLKWSIMFWFFLSFSWMWFIFQVKIICLTINQYHAIRLKGSRLVYADEGNKNRWSIIAHIHPHTHTHTHKIKMKYSPEKNPNWTVNGVSDVLGLRYTISKTQSNVYSVKTSKLCFQLFFFQTLNWLIVVERRWARDRKWKKNEPKNGNAFRLNDNCNIRFRYFAPVGAVLVVV